MSKRTRKPDRPDGCRLFAHSNGQWARKVNGKLRYYGPWDDTYARLPDRESSVSPRQKPAKPRKDFPLYPHSSGQWAKKVKGKTVYFGPWSDPEAALETYLAQKDDLLAGREVRNGEGLTVRELVNHFLTSKRHCDFRVDHPYRDLPFGRLVQRCWVVTFGSLAGAKFPSQQSGTAVRPGGNPRKKDLGRHVVTAYPRT
ncbi:MAG: hypothetical protein ACYTG0_40555 [Planctomycetota bacterium]|jgi:hypothetical protein